MANQTNGHFSANRGNRSLAWALIASLVNPAFSLPFSIFASAAQARDTDIYTSAPLSETTAEPAVLLVLDTSDSMNLGEPWREYDPGSYDSHVEYLWNSPAYIQTISTQDYTLGLSTAGTSGGNFIAGGNANGISVDVPPRDLADINTTRYDSGWFYGASDSDRTSMKTGTLAYANGIHDPDGAGPVPPDPGPRSVYRKYAWSNDSPAGGSADQWTASHNDIWWVPVAGHAGASDPGIENDPRLRSLSLNKFLGMAAMNDFGNTNPLGNPVKRGGAYFGQYQPNWASPWVDARIYNQCSSSLDALMPSTVYAPSSYGKNDGKLLGQHWLRWENYLHLDDQSFPGSDAMTGSYYNGYLNGNRDRNRTGGDVSVSGLTAFPVLRRDGNSAYAGWGNLKPDMGGEPNFAYRMQELARLSDGVELDVVNSFLSVQGQSTRASLANAWVHLLDALPPGGYYSQPNSLTVGTSNITKTRTCAASSGTHWTDARLTDRVPGQTCTPTSGSNADNCNNQNGSCRCSSGNSGDCASVPDPAPCDAGSGSQYDTFYTRDNYGCGWVGTRSRVDSANYSGCHWDAARQQLVVTAEGGGGTYYYGGSCTGSCSGFNCPASVNGGENYCSNTAQASQTIAGVAYSNVTAGNNAGAGCSDLADGTYYWQGGSCQGAYRTAPSVLAPGPNAPVTNDTSACSNTAAGSQSLGGVGYTQVVTNGYVTDGCSDAVDTASSCSVKLGGACIQCGNTTSGPVAVGGSSYGVYDHVSMGVNLTHDCTEDAGPPYIRNTHSSSDRADWDTSWNRNAGGAGNDNDSYTSDSAHAYQNHDIPAINLYSANYLNWKFGAKVCRAGNDPAAAIRTTTGSILATDICRPIGRKTRLQIAKDALTALIDSPSANGVRFALMVFNKTDAGFGNEGGHVAFAMARMGSDTGDPDYANRALLKNRINAMTAASRTPLTETMYEAYRYFRGEAPVYGHLQTLTASGIPVSDGFDATSWNGTVYNSPMLANPSPGNAASCQKNFVILVTDGGPEDDSSADAAVKSLTFASDLGTVSPDTNSDASNANTPSGQFEVTTNNPLSSKINAYTMGPQGIVPFNYFMGSNMTPIRDLVTGEVLAVGSQVTIPGAGADGAALVTRISQVDRFTSLIWYEVADRVVNSQYGISAYSGASTVHPYDPPDSNDQHFVWLDELAYYMAHSDMSPAGGSAGDTIPGVQSVNTYTIGFAGGTSAVLKNAADQGGGQYFTANDSAQLYTALSGSLASIRDWNPSMAMATVPVSAYNRAESGTEVYLAFFGPRLSQSWNGTVKKYRFSTNQNACGVDISGNQLPLCLIGQTYLPASPRMNIQQQIHDPLTGDLLTEVDSAAVNLWGDPTPGQEDGGASNKGGTGYVMKMLSGNSPNTRKVYTYVGAASPSADLTASGNQLRDDNPLITTAMLGDSSMTISRRNTALNYARGGEPANSRCSDLDTSVASTCLTWRAWPHQDVLHSQPALLLYQLVPGQNPADPPTKIEYLFYLTNDGLLHAVDSTSGREAWAYMPEEALPKIASVMDNAANLEHLIVADGSPVVHAVDVNGDGRIVAADGDKAYLVFGLRRGGHSYYALDVSDPIAPKYLWRISNDCTGAGPLCKTISELGETWSKPTLTRLRTISAPVMVFGGGYDPVPNDMLRASITQAAGVANVSVPVRHGYLSGDSVHIAGAVENGYNGDQRITVTGPNTFSFAVAPTMASPAHGQIYVIGNKDAVMGRGVFIVNVATGNLIQKFTKAESGTYPALADMNYSIPSDAVTLNTDQDQGGYADRLYIGDLGGQVWRLDIDKVNNWGVHKFADLTGSITAASPAWLRRKVFFPPAVVGQFVNGQHYDGIFVGTGDRENPLRTDQTDAVFMLKDFALGLGSNQAVVDISTSTIKDVTDTPLISAISDTGGAVGNADEINTTMLALQNAAGWMMRLEFGNVAGPPAKGGGEKLVNSPSIYFNTVRFGTYSPRGPSSACLPPGAGQLYAISAADGTTAVDTNRNGVIGTGDSRVISNYAIRDFSSDGQAAILDGNIVHYSFTDGTLSSENIGKAGVGRAVYWYQEPEQ
jgi:hypothetical protein